MPAVAPTPSLPRYYETTVPDIPVTGAALRLVSIPESPLATVAHALADGGEQTAALERALRGEQTDAQECCFALLAAGSYDEAHGRLLVVVREPGDLLSGLARRVCRPRLAEGQADPPAGWLAFRHGG